MTRGNCGAQSGKRVAGGTGNLGFGWCKVSLVKEKVGRKRLTSLLRRVARGTGTWLIVCDAC